MVKQGRPPRAIGIAALGFMIVMAGASQADPSATKTTWRDLEAYRLTDGRTEAIIVPSLGGRLVHYGRVNGPSFVWTGEPGTERGADALMWGGDKTYIGPHTMWRYTQEQMWPPPSPNTAAFEATIFDGAKLRTVSPRWPAYGARVTREIAFDASGDLVLTHTMEKVPGSLVLGAIWTVTQSVPSEVVYAPLNPNSPYKNGIFWFGSVPSMEHFGASLLSPALLQIHPITGTVFKLGADPAKPALATVKDGVVFVERAEPQEGQYPEGADGAGMSVEIYHHGLPPPREYTELEFLSPMRRLDQGATLTLHWSIRDLPKGAAPEEIQHLFE